MMDAGLPDNGFRSFITNVLRDSIHRTMKKIFLFALVLAALCQPFAGYAEGVADSAVTPDEVRRDKVVRGTKIFMQPGGEHTDSATSLLVNFYLDQFRNSRDPELPYFMFMSKDAQYTMGVGGVIRLRGWYDWHNIMPGTPFSPYNITIPGNPARTRHFDLGPQGTTVYLTFLGHNEHINRIMGYVEGKFNGDGFAFELYKAYITLNDWTAGLAVTTFSDPAASPTLIDGARSNGEATRRNVLVRWLHDINRHWTVAASMEVPKHQINADDKEVEKCPVYVPDFAGFAQYQWDGGRSHIRLSGLLRVMGYRDLLRGRNHSVTGWGVGLTGVWTAIPTWKIFGEFNTGHGIASYLSDLVNDNTDLLMRPDEPGRMYAPMSLGYVLGTQYYFTPKLYGTLSAAEVRYLTKAGSPGSTYKLGTMAAANLCYDFTERIGAGIEYLWGYRKNVDGMHGHANRITAFFQLMF